MRPLHPDASNNPFLKKYFSKPGKPEDETPHPQNNQNAMNNQQLQSLQTENDNLRIQLAQLQARLTQLEAVPKSPTQTSESQFPVVDGLDINEDFKYAIRLMEETSECVFVTGKAGTGKSTLLRYFARNTNKRIALLAYTGVAALNVRGETIHSFFGFPLKPISQDDIRVSSRQQLYSQLDAIVIDEASMVRSDIMDGIDYFMRVNGKNRQKPFGGVQVILFGDLYQLPPIVSSEEENKFFAANYRSEYFFDAHVFK